MCKLINVKDTIFIYKIFFKYTLKKNIPNYIYVYIIANRDILHKYTDT